MGMDMSSELSLRRRNATRPLISLVPMIDVMLILLVFFMVTSTYLNLDMIPALSRSETPEPTLGDSQENGSSALLIRVGADGAPYYRGIAIDEDGLTRLLLEQVEQEPLTQVVILPTGSANIQALVTVMDVVTRAGITNMRVVRLEGQP